MFKTGIRVFSLRCYKPQLIEKNIYTNFTLQIGDYSKNNTYICSVSQILCDNNLNL